LKIPKIPENFYKLLRDFNFKASETIVSGGKALLHGGHKTGLPNMHHGFIF
jgi:hypothetical protein